MIEYIDKLIEIIGAQQKLIMLLLRLLSEHISIDELEDQAEDINIDIEKSI